MASASYKLIDNRQEATEAMDKLRTSDVIGLDCEGVDLSRKGELCVVQVRRFLPPSASGGDVVYLFDVVALGRWLFDSGLRELLESQDVLKLTYDCRNDADALQHQYDVHLDGVRDLQLLGYPYIITPSSKRLIMGLGTALTKYLRGYSDTQLKDACKIMFRDNPAIWKERPLHRKLLEYCANDVRHFMDLYNYFESRIYQGNKPVLMKRWAAASKNYADCKRALPSRLYSQYESNPLLPLRIIPDSTFGGQLIEFLPANTACSGCRRRFNHSELIDSKCLVCHMVDEWSESR